MSRGALAIVTALLTLMTGLLPGCQQSLDEAALQRHQKLAGQLKDTNLYQAAIDEYQKILALDGLDDTKRANINYLIGKIYFEDLSSWENAAAFFVRAQALDSEGSFVQQSARSLVTCLERMGNMVDARRQLSRSTQIDADTTLPGTTMVARIGDEPIWLRDVEAQIQLLPPELQESLIHRQAKVDFVHQYVASELIYRAAVREDYGADPDILRQQELVHKKMLVDKYVIDRIMPEVAIDSLDVDNFYRANRDTRYGGAPFDSVRAQVSMDYSSDKAQAAFHQYIGKLSAVERVEFIDENVR